MQDDRKQAEHEAKVAKITASRAADEMIAKILYGTLATWGLLDILGHILGSLIRG